VATDDNTAQLKASNGMQQLPPMTPQQRQFTESGGLNRYRDLVTGDRNWLFFIGFELYSLFCSNLASIVGLAARRLCLPAFLRSSAGSLVVGKGLTIRQPHRISLAKGVILDDYVTLDVRADKRRDADVGIEIGEHALIGRGTIVVAKDGRIRLGKACNIGSACRIATQSSVEIGDSVLIAAYAYIGPGNHRMDDFDRPLIEQGMDLRGGVRIGEQAWIGARATILDGVTIGREAIVGAHSLVLEDVPDRAIVAGVPAKIVRYRE